MTLRFTGRGLRILDFDCEARPLSWYGGDFVTRELTAIAAQFIGEKRVYCWLLGRDDPIRMLKAFRRLYDQADMVTGHFIRGYDLPAVNAGMLEAGLPPLTAKLSHDTKLDLLRFSGLSKSQENLGALLHLEHPKVQMDQEKWREANRLTARGLALTRRRVVGDVRQHIELRARLLELGLLGPPRVWSGNAPGPEPAYQP